MTTKPIPVRARKKRPSALHVSRIFVTCSKFWWLFRSFQTCLNTFGYVRMRWDTFRYVRMPKKDLDFVFRSPFFPIFARILRSYAKMDVSSRFLSIFCSRYTYFVLTISIWVKTLRSILRSNWRPMTFHITNLAQTSSLQCPTLAVQKCVQCMGIHLRVIKDQLTLSVRE